MGFKNWANYSRYTGSARPAKYGEKKTLFILHQGLFYVSVDGAEYEVPEGTISDLGSIPRIFWPILPRDEFPSSYFLHDWLMGKSWISRLDADKLLKEAILASNAMHWKAKVIYSGVRIGAMFS